MYKGINVHKNLNKWKKSKNSIIVNLKFLTRVASDKMADLASQFNNARNVTIDCC